MIHFEVINEKISHSKSKIDRFFNKFKTDFFLIQESNNQMIKF
jgi:hypothetical protein